jgi:hypothetical protein
MPGASTVSRSRYLNGFKSLVGSIAAIGTTIPALSSVFSTQPWSNYLFPPIDDFFRAVAVLLCLLVILLVFELRDMPFVRDRTRRALAQVGAFVLIICTVISLFISYHYFVRHWDRYVVSIGFTPTAMASKEYPHASEWQLLDNYGGWKEEEGIRKAWTSGSILIARLALFVSYLIGLLSVVALASFTVLFEVLDKPQRGAAGAT